MITPLSKSGPNTKNYNTIKKMSDGAAYRSSWFNVTLTMITAPSAKNPMPN
jgi:hypothetical protein